MTLMTEAGETREDLKLPDYPEVIILSVLEELLGSKFILPPSIRPTRRSCAKSLRRERSWYVLLIADCYTDLICL